MKALVFGEIIWDIYPDGEVIGGAAFNFSAHLAHLGDSAYLVSAVGNDGLGERAMDLAKQHGICMDFIQKNAYPTGACTVTLDEEGVPRYDIRENVSYDNIIIDEKILKAVQTIAPDVFCFNTLIQRSLSSRNSVRRILESCQFKEVFCDINLRKGCFDVDSLEYCMKNATIVKISDEEGHFLYDLGLLEKGSEYFPIEVANKYRNLRFVVYTLGGDGSVVYDVGAKKLYKSKKPCVERVVSTVGAGDCFGATFLFEYMKGADIDTAIDEATKRANIIVSHKEAVPF